MKKEKTVGEIIADLSLPILLIALAIFFTIMSDKFLTPLNITNILVQNAHVAVCSTAVMIIMISGGTDLSIGYQVSVAAVIATKLLSEGAVNVPVAVFLAIMVCALLGTFNGLMGKVLKSHTMIITLGTMAIFQGISYLISGSKTFHNLPTSYMYLGQGKLFGVIPVNILIMVVIVILVAFVMEKTSVGRSVYAVGSNSEAARLAGLNVNKIKILAFSVAGILVGISAILLSARSGSADSSTGLGIEFTGITACVLAGVSLAGGEGKLWKVIVAVYVLGVLANGMQLINLGTYPQYIAKGVIMLVSLYISNRNVKTT